MKKIENKYRILTLLKKIDNDFKNLSINEFIKCIEKEILEEKKLEEKEKENIINTYNSTFLKMHENNKLWGENLRVIKVDSIYCNEFDIDFQKIYTIIGEEISFNKINIFKRKSTLEESNLSFTHEDLKKFEIISEEEYLNFLNKYEFLDKSIKKIFKEK